MHQHLRAAARFFLAIAGCVFGVGLAFQWLEGIGLLLAMLGTLLLPGSLLIGGFVFSVRGVKLAREDDGALRQKIGIAIAAPVMLLVSVASLWPLLAAGSYIGTFSKLAVLGPRYESIIAEARRVPPDDDFTGYRKQGGTTYIIDFGPPVRVAFPSGFGLIDYWSGIVFDPTGDVIRAKGWHPVTGKWYAPDRITKLFGGDLVSCDHLWGSYYHCSFT